MPHGHDDPADCLLRRDAPRGVRGPPGREEALRVHEDTAKIDRKLGGRVSVFGGYAMGKTERIEKDKVIAQTWRTPGFGPDEPDSKVMFHLSKREQGTRLIFVQSDVPDRLTKELRQGWIDFYWTPLKACLESSMASGAAGSSGSRRARSGGTSRRS